MSNLNILLPSLEKALKDLEEYEKVYQISKENVKQQQVKIEKLKCEKQQLLSLVEGCKQVVRNKQDKLIDIQTKIDDALLKRNKAEIANLYNKQIIKQSEDLIKAKTFNFNSFETENTLLQKYQYEKEDLLVQKELLEKTINTNKVKLKNLLC
ncbi:hypothetical protein RN001_001907 [Aquatica leii]|uniref:Uncharacterized protein n=1 Tax=Aquatica leii TaxID=1421715 RepID=A0AAN7PP68_9COLE|nr:hypothetical protein RN001_001907 [Aquatica leii]